MTHTVTIIGIGLLGIIAISGCSQNIGTSTTNPVTALSNAGAKVANSTTSAVSDAAGKASNVMSKAGSSTKIAESKAKTELGGVSKTADKDASIAEKTTKSDLAKAKIVAKIDAGAAAGATGRALTTLASDVTNISGVPVTTIVNGKSVLLKSMPDGLKYYDERLGKGAKPKTGDQVTAYYKGMLLDLSLIHI